MLAINVIFSMSVLLCAHNILNRWFADKTKMLLDKKVYNKFFFWKCYFQHFGWALVLDGITRQDCWWAKSILLDLKEMILVGMQCTLHYFHHCRIIRENCMWFSRMLRYRYMFHNITPPLGIEIPLGACCSGKQKE